jgi:hypothetical protein
MAKHPQYNIEEYTKWRLTFEGGQAFINAYLKKLSKRESDDDFKDRLAITYNPAFAKSAVLEIKDAIFQRMADVKRVGTESYETRVAGGDGGVDNCASNMNYFIGQCILPELLSMKKVGVFVDMPRLPEGNLSLADVKGKNPYLYTYSAEQILNWNYGIDGTYDAVSLEDTEIIYENRMPVGSIKIQKDIIKLEDGRTLIQIKRPEGENEEYYLKVYPFVCFEISDSLLADVANYQIAYLNIASSDVAFITKGNFPFYTEQYDPASEGNVYTRDSSIDPTDKKKEIQIGVAQGRRFPKSVERPAFIHPSPEPLLASMKKQEQMKEEVRHLVHLTTKNLSPSMASAESKSKDDRTLEASLSNIGLVLEKGENQIATIWKAYEGQNILTYVKYPERYSLKSEADRKAEGDTLKGLMESVPSLTYRKQIAKKIADITLGPTVSDAELKKIFKEIDDAPIVVTDVDKMQKDVELGILDADTAAKGRMYPEGTAEKAAKEHAEKLARIAASQSEVIQGVNQDKQAAKDSKTASQDRTNNPEPGNKTRGEGK